VSEKASCACIESALRKQFYHTTAASGIL